MHHDLSRNLLHDLSRGLVHHLFRDMHYDQWYCHSLQILFAVLLYWCFDEGDESWHIQRGMEYDNICGWEMVQRVEWSEEHHLSG